MFAVHDIYMMLRRRWAVLSVACLVALVCFSTAHTVDLSGYHEEEVSYPHLTASHILAGTLTLPPSPGPFPAVILISGSGPQDRNALIMGHKPFLVLADYLTRRGVAVLRFDDRGVGKSTGDFAYATSMDFASDVLAGVRYLQTRADIDRHRIGLIGHSEGGLIAPMVAVQAPEIAFLVLLAGVGLPAQDTLWFQTEHLLRARGVSANVRALFHRLDERIAAILTQEPDNSKAIYQIRVFFAKTWQQLDRDMQRAAYRLGATHVALPSHLRVLVRPWFRFLLTYDPRETLQHVLCPVLALNGTNDPLVPAQVHLPAIAQALAMGGNTAVVMRELSGLNHLFQAAETGLPEEYKTIAETFSPKALAVIGDWIQVLIAPPTDGR